jgi:hypothetical protein
MRNERDATREEAQRAEAPDGEFRMNNARVILCLVISAGTCILGLLIIYAGLVVAFDPPVINQRVGTILLGAIMAVFSLVLFAPNWKKYGQHVQVFAKGFRFHHRGQCTEVYWEDVAAVWQSSATIHGSRALLETDLWIEVKDGKTIYLSSFFRDMARLVEIILTAKAQRMLPVMSSQLQQGQTLVFGKLQINATALVASGKSLAWDNVHAVRVVHGAIDIQRKGDNRTWFYIYIKKIPNYHLFLDLADMRLNAAGAKRQQNGNP